MPDFTPSRSDAIRDALIRRTGSSLHGRAATESMSATAPAAPGDRALAIRRVPRGHGTQWATASVALVLVAGVVAISATAALNTGAPIGAAPTTSTMESPARPTPTPTSTATPPGVPGPSATPAPLDDPADPTTWIVSQSGIGPLRIGMPFPEAVTVLPNASNACDHAYRGADTELFIARWGTNADDHLDVVSWARAPGPKTAEGIGIGSSPDDVRAAYPSGVEVQRQGTYIQTGNIFFRIETGAVDEIGVTSGDIPWEYCG